MPKWHADGRYYALPQLDHASFPSDSDSEPISSDGSDQDASNEELFDSMVRSAAEHETPGATQVKSAAQVLPVTDMGRNPKRGSAVKQTSTKKQLTSGAIEPVAQPLLGAAPHLPSPADSAPQGSEIETSVSGEGTPEARGSRSQRVWLSQRTKTLASETLDDQLEDVAGMFMKQPVEGGPSNLSERLQGVIAGKSSLRFLEAAAIQGKLRRRINSINERICELDVLDLGDRGEERKDDDVFLQGLLNTKPKATGPSKSAEVTFQMRNIRRILHSLHWPNLQNELRRWVKRGGETEQSMRDFLASIKGMDREVRMLLDHKERGEEYLVKRSFAITAQMKNYHAKMVSIASKLGRDTAAQRTKRAQLSKALARQFIEQKSFMRQMERARAAAAGAAGPGDSDDEDEDPDAMADSDVKSPTSPSKKNTADTKDQEDDKKEKKANDSLPKKRGSDKDKEKEDDEISVADPDTEFDINSFDDQRYGHLKNIYHRHDEKIQELKATIEKDSAELARVQDEITRKLEEEASAKATATGVNSKTQKMANLLSAMGPEAQRKFMLLRERDALAKFLNESTCEDVDAQKRRGELANKQRGPDGLLLESEVMEEKPHSADSQISAVRMGKQTSSNAKARELESREKASENERIQALERELEALRDTLAAKSRQAATIVSETNAEAKELGLGKKMWAMESQSLKVFYLINPQKPVMNVLLASAERVLEAFPSKGPGSGNRHELAMALEHARETFAAEEDARMNWYEKKVEFKAARWKAATDKAIASLTQKLDSTFNKVSVDKRATTADSSSAPGTTEDRKSTAKSSAPISRQSASSTLRGGGLDQSGQSWQRSGQSWQDPEGPPMNKEAMAKRMEQAQQIVELHSKVQQKQSEIEGLKIRINQLEPSAFAEVAERARTANKDGEAESGTHIGSRNPTGVMIPAKLNTISSYLEGTVDKGIEGGVHLVDAHPGGGSTSPRRATSQSRQHATSTAAHSDRKVSTARSEAAASPSVCSEAPSSSMQRSSSGGQTPPTTKSGAPSGAQQAALSAAQPGARQVSGGSAPSNRGSSRSRSAVDLSGDVQSSKTAVRPVEPDARLSGILRVDDEGAARLNGNTKVRRDLAVMLKQCERTYKVLTLRRNQKFQVFKRSLVKIGMAKEAERAMKPEIQSEKEVRLKQELEAAKENVRSLQRMVAFWENRIKTREQKLQEEKRKLQQLGPSWRLLLDNLKTSGKQAALDAEDEGRKSIAGQQVWRGLVNATDANAQPNKPVQLVVGNNAKVPAKGWNSVAENFSMLANMPSTQGAEQRRPTVEGFRQFLDELSWNANTAKESVSPVLSVGRASAGRASAKGIIRRGTTVDLQRQESSDLSNMRPATQQLAAQLANQPSGMTVVNAISSHFDGAGSSVEKLQTSAVKTLTRLLISQSDNHTAKAKPSQPPTPVPARRRSLVVDIFNASQPAKPSGTASELSIIAHSNRRRMSAVDVNVAIRRASNQRRSTVLSRGAMRALSHVLTSASGGNDDKIWGPIAKTLTLKEEETRDPHSAAVTKAGLENYEKFVKAAASLGSSGGFDPQRRLSFQPRRTLVAAELSVVSDHSRFKMVKPKRLRRSSLLPQTMARRRSLSDPEFAVSSSGGSPQRPPLKKARSSKGSPMEPADADPVKPEEELQDLASASQEEGQTSDDGTQSEPASLATKLSERLQKQYTRQFKKESIVGFSLASNLKELVARSWRGANLDNLRRKSGPSAGRSRGVRSFVAEMAHNDSEGVVGKKHGLLYEHAEAAMKAARLVKGLNSLVPERASITKAPHPVSSKKAPLVQRGLEVRASSKLTVSSVESEEEDTWEHLDDLKSARARNLIQQVREALLQTHQTYQALWKYLTHGGSRARLEKAKLARILVEYGFKHDAADTIIQYALHLRGVHIAVASELTRHDFVAVMQSTEPISSLTKLRKRLMHKYGTFQAAFIAFDANHSRFLNDREFARLCISVGGALQDARSLFQLMLPQDGVGPGQVRVSLDAFVTSLRHAEGLDVVAHLRRRIARNGDGPVDAFKQIDKRYFDRPVDDPAELAEALSSFGLTKRGAEHLFKVVYPKVPAASVMMQDVVLRILGGIGPIHDQLVRAVSEHSEKHMSFPERVGAALGSPTHRERADARMAASLNLLTSTVRQASPMPGIQVIDSSRQRGLARLRKLGASDAFRTYQSAFELMEATGVDPHVKMASAEFAKALNKSAGLRLEACRELFAAVDEARAGRASLVDLIDAARRARPLESLAQLRHFLRRKAPAGSDPVVAFKDVELVDGAVVDIQKWSAWLYRFGIESDDARSLFHLIDTDGDSEITREEFEEALVASQHRRNSGQGPAAARSHEKEVAQLSRILAEKGKKLTAALQVRAPDEMLGMEDVRRAFFNASLPLPDAISIFNLLTKSKDAKVVTVQELMIQVQKLVQKHRPDSRRWGSKTSADPAPAGSRTVTAVGAENTDEGSLSESPFFPQGAKKASPRPGRRLSKPGQASSPASPARAVRREPDLSGLHPPSRRLILPESSQSPRKPESKVVGPIAPSPERRRKRNDATRWRRALGSGSAESGTLPLASEDLGDVPSKSKAAAVDPAALPNLAVLAGVATPPSARGSEPSTGGVASRRGSTACAGAGTLPKLSTPLKGDVEDMALGGKAVHNQSHVALPALPLAGLSAGGPPGCGIDRAVSARLPLARLEAGGVGSALRDRRHSAQSPREQRVAQWKQLIASDAAGELKLPALSTRSVGMGRR